MSAAQLSNRTLQDFLAAYAKARPLLQNFVDYGHEDFGESETIRDLLDKADAIGNSVAKSNDE